MFKGYQTEFSPETSKIPEQKLNSKNHSRKKPIEGLNLKPRFLTRALYQIDVVFLAILLIQILILNGSSPIFV
jgi:hypothetical protein